MDDIERTTAIIQGVGLYYETSGSGVPVLLISGLGSNTELWRQQTPVLSTHHRVVRFDNRGSGRSDVPQGPYTVQEMASEAVQLLDALDITAAHIVGSSMGGMIAQEVAIQYPDKALSLTLLAAQCGGTHAFGAAPENAQALEDLATLDMSPQERARAWVPYTLSQDFRTTHPDLVEEYVRESALYPPTTAGLRAQWTALMSYDSWERLPLVTAPALILQGDQDVLVPQENADVLGVRIPDSQVVIIPGAGHSLAFEAAEIVNELLLGFFAENCDDGSALE
ncbi:MAG: alpha/beta fold hydrolase [Dehalococcoidia bacterium]|nr:MAG: alpha/beta fold hydrolase [Dehalococcoidia bacterium]